MAPTLVANGVVFVSGQFPIDLDYRPDDCLHFPGRRLGAINATYARIMGEHRPSRAIVPVLPLHHGAGIEIQCIAVLPAGRAQ